MAPTAAAATMTLTRHRHAFLFIGVFGIEAFVTPNAPHGSAVVHPKLFRRGANANDDHYNNGSDDVPSMDWLTDSLSSTALSTTEEENAQFNDNDDDNDVDYPFLEELDDDAMAENIPIPTTGVSLADEMANAQRDRFYSEVVPISGLGDADNNHEEGGEEGSNSSSKVWAAQIISSTAAGSYEPLRYLVRLPSKRSATINDKKKNADRKDEKTTASFVMVDVPPFSPQLLDEIQKAMSKNGGNKIAADKKKDGSSRLAAILITSQDGIHYDDDPGIYTNRRNDLFQWRKAFPEATVVANRMDIPRDCRDAVTQRLDGYGPWAAAAIEIPNVVDGDDSENLVTFVETGRPLIRKEWDPEMAQAIMKGTMKPPSSNDDSDASTSTTAAGGGGDYTIEAIRAKEDGKQILAVYTPGRTHGSMCYVFPQLGLCASGFTVPLEDARADENTGMDAPGPALDFRGYITTSKAGIAKQMESSRRLIDEYADRFGVLLPSKGDPFYLEGSVKTRQRALREIVDQYEKLGMIYEQLGIMSETSF